MSERCCTAVPFRLGIAAMEPIGAPFQALVPGRGDSRRSPRIRTDSCSLRRAAGAMVADHVHRRPRRRGYAGTGHRGGPRCTGDCRADRRHAASAVKAGPSLEKPLRALPSAEGLNPSPSAEVASLQRFRVV